MQRKSEAGELLPEVPTALKQRWYFTVLPCCFGSLFCVLLTDSCSTGGLFGIHWCVWVFLLTKAGILKLAGEMTKAFQGFIVIDGLFLQTQLCLCHWCETSSWKVSTKLHAYECPELPVVLMGQRVHWVKLCAAFRDCFIELCHGEGVRKATEVFCLFFWILVILIGLCLVVNIKWMGTYLYYGVSKFNCLVVLWLVATIVPWIVEWDVSPFFSCQIFCLACETPP